MSALAIHDSLSDLRPRGRGIVLATAMWAQDEANGLIHDGDAPDWDTLLEWSRDA